MLQAQMRPLLQPWALSCDCAPSKATRAPGGPEPCACRRVHTHPFLEDWTSVKLLTSRLLAAHLLCLSINTHEQLWKAEKARIKGVPAVKQSFSVHGASGDAVSLRIYLLVKSECHWFLSIGV